MMKTDELMEFMIQEGERLVEEVECYKMINGVSKNVIAGVRAEVYQASTDLRQEQDRTERLKHQLKELEAAANKRDLQGYVGCALMGFIAGALTAWAFLL